MQMSGNTILITGGGSGIGRGLAEAFHALGNKVVIAGRRRAALDKVAAANPGVATAALDIENPQAIRDFAARLTAEHPGLNVLINNAGVMRPENLKSPPGELADAEAMVTTNVLGPMRLTAALTPHLLKQPHAAVMTVTSGLAFMPLAMTPTYCATKAAMHSWIQSLRYQLKGAAVQVLELAPPYVQTELMGEQQASDPRAMPLKDFIAEVMQILKTTPEADEILVERVKPLRFAEASGAYAATFTQLNDALSVDWT
jgi:uncharacterized oxidoreductase